MFEKPVDLFCGECLSVIKEFEDNCIDSIVTDPPYGIKFMSKKWDYSVPSVDIWKECLRVLKPGGHLLSFGGVRTYHRLVVNIEDAGFEILDQIQWIFGNGFPKSKYSLKPANEPICLARKKYIGSIKDNIGVYNTGGLNIDDSRISTDDNIRFREGKSDYIGIGTFMEKAGRKYSQNEDGRWPSNIILSHHPDCEFLGYKKVRNKSGSLSGLEPSKPGKNVYSQFDYRGSWIRHGDENGFETIEDWKCHPACPVRLMGNKARFFYCSKAKKKDRDDGLNSSRPQFKHGMLLSDCRNREFIGNFHETVKPTDLMKYLCRLVTQMDGVILDPFMGSGSTGRGAVMEGFNFVGIEIDKEYFELAKSRINAAMRKRQMRLFDDIDV
jgi:site-specific DNA-methyltransferase (adenine-specific)